MKFKNLAKNFIAGLMVLSAGAFVFMCACGESSAEVPSEKDPFEEAEQNPSETEEPSLPEKPAYVPYAEYEPFGRDKFGIEATGYIENSEGNLVECELFLRPYHVIDAEFLYACGQNDFAGAAMWQENSMGAKNAFCVGKYNNDIKSLGSWLIITVDFTPEQSQDEMARLNAIIYERVKNNICIYDYEYYSNLFLSADNADKQ